MSSIANTILLAETVVILSSLPYYFIHFGHIACLLTHLAQCQIPLFHKILPNLMTEKREKAKRAMMAGLESSESYSSSDSEPLNDNTSSTTTDPTPTIREPVVRRLLESWDELYPFLRKRK